MPVHHFLHRGSVTIRSQNMILTFAKWLGSFLLVIQNKGFVNCFLFFFFFIYSKTQKLIEHPPSSLYMLTTAVNASTSPTQLDLSLADTSQQGERARVAWRFAPCTRAIFISGCSFFHWAPWRRAGGRHAKRKMRKVCWQLAKPSVALDLTSPK